MDEFTRGYVETALWFTVMHEGAVQSHLSPSALDVLQRDAKRFQREQGELLSQAYAVPGYDPSTAGHDFWLTRNGHGAGFWDGDLPNEIGQALTTAAHAFGEQDLYVGDDGKVYVSGAEALNESHPPVATEVARGTIAQDFPSPEDAMHHAAHVGFTHFTQVGKHITLYGPGPDGMSARARLFYAKGKYHLSKPALTKKPIPKRAHPIEHTHEHTQHGGHVPDSGVRPTGVHEPMAASPEDAAAAMLQRYSSPRKALEMAQIHSQDYTEGTPEHRYWREVADAIRRQARLDPSGHRAHAGTRQEEDYYVVVQGRIVEGPFQSFGHASGRATALGGAVIYGVPAQYRGVEPKPRSRYVGAPADHRIISDGEHRGLTYRVYSDYEDPSATCAVVITQPGGEGWHLEGYPDANAAETAARASIDEHLGSGLASESAREKGVVWLHRPDGVYWANATGGTYWLIPTPGGGYSTSWSPTHGTPQDLGIHPLATAFQVVAGHQPATAQPPRQQVAEAPPRHEGSKLTFSRAKEILNSVGMTISKKVGEYRVNYQGGDEGTAYYTDDLEDAVVTGSVMAVRRYGQRQTDPYSAPAPSPYDLPPIRPLGFPPPRGGYGPNEASR
jgi:hypothetical protein